LFVTRLLAFFLAGFLTFLLAFFIFAYMLGEEKKGTTPPFFGFCQRDSLTVPDFLKVNSSIQSEPTEVRSFDEIFLNSTRKLVPTGRRFIKTGEKSTKLWLVFRTHPMIDDCSFWEEEETR